MIKQIFKIIWNERRINAWIVSELILIFTILWFCCNYLYQMGSKYIEPLGFDITNTYQVQIGTIPSSVIEVPEEDKIAAMKDMIKRLKAHPQVENVSFSFNSLPYSGSWNGDSYKVKNELISFWDKRVDANFFEVFKIKFLEGRNFTPDELINKNVCILGDNKNSIVNDNINLFSIDSVSEKNNNLVYKVVGVADKVKRSEFAPYSSIIYRPLTEIDLIKDYAWGIEIAMRVKPEADNKDFRNKFIAEMREQLNVTPFFLVDITPLSDSRTYYTQMTGDDSNLKSTYTILLFLLINIALGIIGTFWLRTESRRSEIGLQMALGASRNRIKKTYLAEAIFLLLIASIVGLILSINIQITGVFNQLNLPMISKYDSQISTLQIFINYLLSLIVLSVIIIVSVWYPSQKASKVSPASVLKGE